MTSVRSINSTDNNNYKQIALATTGAIIGWEAEPIIKRTLYTPMRNYVSNSFKETQNKDFKSYLEQAVKDFPDKKLKLIDINESNAEQIKKELGIRPAYSNTLEKIKNHILRKYNSRDIVFREMVKGKNAMYHSLKNKIYCNIEKFGAAAFHELGHAYNYTSRNPAIVALTVLRAPMFIRHLPMGVSLIAMLKNPNPNGEVNTPEDFVKKYCGLITGASALPIAIEESIASYRGYKLAKNVGVTGEKLQIVKKACKTSAFAYCAGAICLGLATQTASKMRDIICLPNYLKANTEKDSNSTI